jgi:ATP-dependent exoDNAse (exonuclease V) alpha subunit
MLLKSSSEQEYAWRTSELYLNRAEAYIELYKKGNQEAGQNAVNDLNTLLSKRYRDYEPLTLKSADELQELYREERRKELCFEGFRWFDLRRTTRPAMQRTGYSQEVASLEQDDPRYVLQIPQRELSVNPIIGANPR